MVIKKKKIADLKPAPYNPRKSNEKEEANLTASLEKFGVVEPIIWNEQTGFIVGGHFRVRQLIKLGKKTVDCVIVNLSEEDEKELNIRLNANTGEWDWDQITKEWNEEKLEEWGLDVWVAPEEEEEDIEPKKESTNLTIKCEDIDELNELKQKLDIQDNSISFSKFLVKTAL